MVFRPGRNSPENNEFDSFPEPLSRGARTILKLIDAVGTIQDGNHLQCIAFLAKEFGLRPDSPFVFGSIGPDPRRPHSLLLESHLMALLREGIVELDGAGRLHVRHDLFALPPSAPTGRRLAALGALSPREAAIFAAAVLRLAGEGRHAGSLRHDDAFGATVTHLIATAGGVSEDSTIDVAAICDVRRRLLPAEPVMLAPV